MAYVVSSKSQIYYEVAGEGPPLIFAHGVGGNHASWFEQVSALSARYRVIVWDQRGFGRSSDVEGLGRSGFPDDLARLVDALDIDRCVVVGQSMGGGACLSYACAHPDRIAGLVMADSLVGLQLPEALAAQMREVERHTAGLSQLERVLGETTRRQRPSAMVLYRQIAGFNRTNFQTLTGRQKLWSTTDIVGLNKPVLLIVGEEDILFPPWAVQEVHELLPGSRLVRLSGTGHSAFFERPDAFNAALETWLIDIGYAPSAQAPIPRQEVSS